jgi:hypothetical protein
MSNNSQDVEKHLVLCWKSAQDVMVMVDLLLQMNVEIQVSQLA